MRSLELESSSLHPSPATTWSSGWWWIFKLKPLFCGRDLKMEQISVAADEEEQAQIWHFIFGFADSMALKCAELHIPDILHSHPQPITLSQIASSLPHDPTNVNSRPDTAYLARIMRLLVCRKIFTVERKPSDGGDGEKLYGPTRYSKWLYIMHDWNDEDCVKILKNCRKAIPEKTGKVVIVDIVLRPDGNGTFDDMGFIFDLLMIAHVSGRKERTEVEWKNILDQSGFPRYKIINIPALSWIIEINLDIPPHAT